MNRYIIIRSDTKSISPPMSKQEAIKKIKQYDKDGISTYVIYKNKHTNINSINKSSSI